MYEQVANTRCSVFLAPKNPLSPPDHPCQLHAVLLFTTTPAKHALIPDFCFVSPFFPVPHCKYVPTHAYEPIFTRQHPSAPLFDWHRKTWCSGKFPPAIVPKQRPVRPFLTLLVLFLCPPVPLHPTTPIRTYPHPYIFIFSPLHPVYMCYTCKFKLKNINLNHLNIKFQTYY